MLGLQHGMETVESVVLEVGTRVPQETRELFIGQATELVQGIVWRHEKGGI